MPRKPRPRGPELSPDEREFARAVARERRNRWRRGPLTWLELFRVMRKLGYRKADLIEEYRGLAA